MDKGFQKVIVATKQVAVFFSVAERSVRRWAEKGCPRAGHGKWDLKAVHHWWLENLYKAEEDGEQLAEAKLEYWQAKARSEKVKASVAEGSTMAVEDFKKAWVQRVAEMSSGLRSITLRIAPLLTGKTEKEMKSILDTEIWNILNNFSRDGRFTPVLKANSKSKKIKKKVKKTK